MSFWQRIWQRRGEATAEVLRLLAEPDDVRKVGALVEALGGGGRALRAAVEGALVRLLPRLRPHDAPLLTAEHRLTLNRALLGGGGVPLTLATLKAWEQVGDEACLPYVEKLAASEEKNMIQQRVRRAAQECLPFVHLRAEQARETNTLLRGSVEPRMAPELLLRPSSPPSVPADALRPAPEAEEAIAR